jgi:hypothetical protein
MNILLKIVVQVDFFVMLIPRILWLRILKRIAHVNQEFKKLFNPIGSTLNAAVPTPGAINTLLNSRQQQGYYKYRYSSHSTHLGHSQYLEKCTSIAFFSTSQHSAVIHPTFVVKPRSKNPRTDKLLGRTNRRQKKIRKGYLQKKIVGIKKNTVRRCLPIFRSVKILARVMSAETESTANELTRGQLRTKVYDRLRQRSKLRKKWSRVLEYYQTCCVLQRQPVRWVPKRRWRYRKAQLSGTNFIRKFISRPRWKVGAFVRKRHQKRQERARFLHPWGRRRFVLTRFRHKIKKGWLRGSLSYRTWWIYKKNSCTRRSLFQKMKNQKRYLARSRSFAQKLQQTPIRWARSLKRQRVIRRLPILTTLTSFRRYDRRGMWQRTRHNAEVFPRIARGNRIFNNFTARGRTYWHTHHSLLWGVTRAPILIKAAAKTRQRRRLKRMLWRRVCGRLASWMRHKRIRKKKTYWSQIGARRTKVTEFNLILTHDTVRSWLLQHVWKNHGTSIHRLAAVTEQLTKRLSRATPYVDTWRIAKVPTVFSAWPWRNTGKTQRLQRATAYLNREVRQFNSRFIKRWCAEDPFTTTRKNQRLLWSELPETSSASFKRSAYTRNITWTSVSTAARSTRRLRRTRIISGLNSFVTSSTTKISPKSILPKIRREIRSGIFDRVLANKRPLKKWNKRLLTTQLLIYTRVLRRRGEATRSITGWRIRSKDWWKKWWNRTLSLDCSIRGAWERAQQYWSSGAYLYARRLPTLLHTAKQRYLAQQSTLALQQQAAYHLRVSAKKLLFSKATLAVYRKNIIQHARRQLLLGRLHHGQKRRASNLLRASTRIALTSLRTDARKPWAARIRALRCSQRQMKQRITKSLIRVQAYLSELQLLWPQLQQER